MEYFENHGFLTFEILDEEKEILRFTIADWKEHCTHLQYNYYSYKGSGFFFFPLPVGRLLLKTARKEVGIVFSELDAIMDMWLHTILNDPKVRGLSICRLSITPICEVCRCSHILTLLVVGAGQSPESDASC